MGGRALNRGAVSRDAGDARDSRPEEQGCHDNSNGRKTSWRGQLTLPSKLRCSDSFLDVTFANEVKIITPNS
jgi:hypothetical protein